MLFVIVAGLTFPVLKSLDRSLLATVMGASACQTMQLECFHLSLPLHMTCSTSVCFFEWYPVTSGSTAPHSAHALAQACLQCCAFI